MKLQGQSFWNSLGDSVGARGINTPNEFRDLFASVVKHLMIVTYIDV